MLRVKVLQLYRQVDVKLALLLVHLLRTIKMGNLCRERKGGRPGCANLRGKLPSWRRSKWSGFKVSGRKSVIRILHHISSICTTFVYYFAFGIMQTSQASSP